MAQSFTVKRTVSATRGCNGRCFESPTTAMTRCGPGLSESSTNSVCPRPRWMMPVTPRGIVWSTGVPCRRQDARLAQPHRPQGGSHACGGIVAVPGDPQQGRSMLRPYIFYHLGDGEGGTVLAPQCAQVQQAAIRRPQECMGDGLA